jgi:prophage DNA circulation protein
MQKHLEKQVAETAAVVTEWKSAISKIETQFNVANLARANAKKIREANALKASMGDAAAIGAVKHARSEQHTAEETIGDLKIALPEAEAQLAAAEKAAASARHELAKLHGEKLMRQRVAAAARMDAAFSEAASAYIDFERLGRELQSFPDLGIAVSGNMSHWETVTGFRRIASALPMFFLKLFPTTWTNEDARQSLAASEEKLWQLQPEQPAAKAA